MITILRRLAVVMVVAIALVSCAPGGQKAEDTRLKMGLLPIMDTLPFYVADQKGYYRAEGITVELVPVKGAQERDALLQAGEIDGVLTDLVAVGLFDREKPQLKVVATAMRASPQAAMFRILAAPGSGLTSPAQLAGVPIAISQNSIIQYVTDRLLAAEGLPAGQIQVIEVSAIPVRFEQLMAGQIKAATLPDPLASGALVAGAQLIVDDTQHTQYSQTVLAFSQAAVDAKPNTIKRFLSAWDKAVQDLNSQPDQFANLLIEKGRVPEGIRGSFKMPTFARATVPTQSEWQDVVAWMLEKKLIEREIPYQSAVLTGLGNP